MDYDQQNARKLFTSFQIGAMQLSRRIVMSHLTRTRCPNGVPGDIVAKYYAQRATPGGLLISEGILPSFMMLPTPPCTYTQGHITAWGSVTDTVHARGAYLVCQLWHAISPMSFVEIRETITDFAHASGCAIEAGFDCVETLEIFDTVSTATETVRTAMRFSLFGVFLIPLDTDSLGTYRYVLSEIEERCFAYICLTQPQHDMFLPEIIEIDRLRSAAANSTSKWFVSIPDLVENIKRKLPLAPWNPELLYTGVEEGYTEYPALV
ncbi:NADH-flavin oxidoreductase/NADH oxidase [Calycina marina]|uniref:NADH-flavin oxidoreductase/NADH oxidase n=1 Tax=Calycina marina TaxID=1763456 RepID=A0A9P7Z305_9HELO|nr:NADH-flavin oxidoreductase/NADH oxidase [Calycina marina]